MDFTISIYKKLLHALINQGYQFQSFEAYLKNPKERVILLRHDVDDRKLHSLEFAKIQAELGIVGTYYFRVVPKSFDKQVIQEIHKLGHEIGYHYEDMDFAKGNPDEAIKYFKKHLEKLRAVAPIQTICMHGSPKSKYDNKDVWQKYDYKKYDIVGEPYFDLNFDDMAYYTDTGRMWDGFKVSVRDKVKSSGQFPVFHTTHEMIECIEAGQFPQRVMMNFHPQRWTDNQWLWRKDAFIQNLKNQVKKQIVKRQHD
jgi:hypothetical protein